MIFRNSLLSLTRSRGKTALFTLLIFTLTLTLALGISVWASVEQFLDDCDDFYTTIGLVEYMGTDYPNDTAYDSLMDQALDDFDPSAIKTDEAELSWEMPSRSLGYIKGFSRTDNFMADRMLSVLVVGNVYYESENNVYSALVMDSLYSLKSKKDTILLIDANFGEFEKGHYYLVFGEVYFGRSPLLHLRLAPFDNAIAAEYGISVPHMVDITVETPEGNHYEIPEGSPLTIAARTLPVTNNSLLVESTDNLMSLLPFHQQELYFVEGRPFTEAEYANGDRVIVISELVAARLGIEVGGTVELSVAVSGQPGIYNSYWAEDGFAFTGDFKVVGITNTVKDKSWYVYVPRAAGVPASEFPVGYTVGQVVIRNEDAIGFLARVQPQLGDRFQLTIYDQGYSTVAIPYNTILRVAKIVTSVCGLVELAVVILFGFLFVYRQRETSETMLMLGTSRKGVCAYFLFSAGLIALLATLAGAVVGYLLHDGIIAWVIQAAHKFTLIDSRYSNGNLTISKTLEFAPELKIGFFLVVAAAVFLLAVLACMGFVISTFIHSKPSEKMPAGPKKEHRTSHLRGGSMKYAWLSILRGGARSLVVPVLAISVVVFFGQLATTSLRYQEQLESIYDSTRISGYYTDINGKQVGNLVLDAYDVANLYRSGRVDALSISIGNPYYYLGIKRLANGTEFELSPLYVPNSYFAQESLEAAIMRGADLTATNNIRTSPDFFYADDVFMTFLDGYDETILQVPTSDSRVFSCIVPSSLLSEKGLKLGDTLRVAINHIISNPEDGRRIYVHADLQIVGSYEKQGAEDVIYAPLSLLFNSWLIWDEDQPTFGSPTATFDTGYTMTSLQEHVLQQTTFNGSNFVLVDSHALADFKDYLSDYGYSQVNDVSSVREFIVLKDASFNNAVASVNQQIRYVNTLYPCLYTLVGIIALVVSYLLVVSRKREFATMRGLGATKKGTFFSFFFEQGILCLFGTFIGLVVWYFIWGWPSGLHLLLTGAFLACYFIGCAISIYIMNNTNVLTILMDRD